MPSKHQTKLKTGKQHKIYMEQAPIERTSSANHEFDYTIKVNSKYWT